MLSVTSARTINKPPSLSSRQKPFAAGNGQIRARFHNSVRALRPSVGALSSRKLKTRRAQSGITRASAAACQAVTSTNITAVITVKVSGSVDAFFKDYVLGQTLPLELVSAELDPNAIKQWVEVYMNHYYPESCLVESDHELQKWWEEVRTRGHEDKKDKTWWPELKTPQDLVRIGTNIIWVASGLQAAVNFEQYAYAGYFPNRPMITRTKMPTDDPTHEVKKSFNEKSESLLLRCFPSQMQAAKVMSMLSMLSSHSVDEEYLGEEVEPAWKEEPTIKAAFRRFKERLEDLEKTIDTRNNETKLKNRNGDGIVPYELLKPNS